MGKHAQLIMGPAGSGKSTYCNTIRLHCENAKRVVHCVNLDPSAEVFAYPVTVDIRELISVDEVMEELPYGPNGALVYAMEFLLENLEWFEEQLGDYEDDYLLLDCPGQIELYSHMDMMKRLADQLVQWGYSVCAVYLLDSHFVMEPSKFIAGTLMCLSTMIRLELPHVNLLTKVDLLESPSEKKRRKRRNVKLEQLHISQRNKNRDRDNNNNNDNEEDNDENEEEEEASDDEKDYDSSEEVDKKLSKFLDNDVNSLVSELNEEMNPKFHKLNLAMASLIEDYSMVGFLPFNMKDEESVTDVLAHIDNAIQYGEDTEVMVPRYEEDEDEDDDDHHPDEDADPDDF